MDDGAKLNDRVCKYFLEALLESAVSKRVQDEVGSVCFVLTVTTIQLTIIRQISVHF